MQYLISPFLHIIFFYVSIFLLQHHLISSKHISYIGFCSILTNELDIIEWIDYHLQLDIQRIYLYQYSNYTVGKDRLKPYITKQQIQLITIEGNKMQITEVFQNCLERFRINHQFLAFLTTDEYIITKNTCSISSILTGYEKYGGLVINWKLFGSSNLMHRPEFGGLLSNYYQCKTYDHYRSIVNTDHVLKIAGNPHSFLYKNEKYAVDSNYIRVNHVRNFPRFSLYDLIYINNYHLKSYDDFQRIFQRPVIFHYIGNDHSYFEHINKYCDEVCPAVLMPNQVKSRMKHEQCLEMVKQRLMNIESSEPLLFPA